MVKFAKMSQNEASQGQISIFGSMSAEDQGNPVFKLKEVKPATLIERLNFEKQYLGLYVSGHPLRGLTKYLAKKVNLISSLTKRNIGKPVKLGGILASSKKVFTKSGAYMMYGELEDPTGRIEMVVFPKIFNQYQEYFKEGLILVMDGRLDMRGNGLQFSVNSAKTVSLDSMITNAKEAGLYNEKEKISRKHIVFEVEKKEMVDPMDESDQLYVAPDSYTEAWKENSYQIEIKAGTNPNKLNELKNLLLSAQGERKVDLNIYDNSGNFTKLKLPFGINLSNDLEDQIHSLLQ
jgi:DNA polymerase III alpha subunit